LETVWGNWNGTRDRKNFFVVTETDVAGLVDYYCSQAPYWSFSLVVVWAINADPNCSLGYCCNPGPYFHSVLVVWGTNVVRLD